jgi:hypothetical protein
MDTHSQYLPHRNTAVRECLLHDASFPPHYKHYFSSLAYRFAQVLGGVLLLRRYLSKAADADRKILIRWPRN